MTIEIAQDLVLAVFALVVMVTDFRWRRIPNVVTYPAMAIGLALAAVERFPGEILGSPAGFIDHLLALVAALVLLYPLFSARAMKAGDVKLLMTVGALKGLLFLFWSFVYGAVIGGVTLHRVFGRDPQPVPAAGLPAGLTRLAQLAGELFEEVLAAHEAVMHDARADIARDDDFDFTVRDAIAVRPAFEIDFFDFDCSHSAQGKSQGNSDRLVHRPLLCRRFGR